MARLFNEFRPGEFEYVTFASRHSSSLTCFRYVRSFITFRGASGVANLSRCNIYSSVFNWRIVQGTEILHVRDQPVLCYMVGFAKTSNILEPIPLGSTGKHIKEVTFQPSVHELPRCLAALAYLTNKDDMSLRCWDGAVKVTTRQRNIDGNASGTSSARSRRSYSTFHFHFAYSF